MKHARRVFAMVAFMTACAVPQDVQAPDAALSPAEQRKVLQYLNCVDCIAQLDSVRALGQRKAKATVDSLNAALLNGPDSGTVAAGDSILRLGYQRDSVWRSTQGLPLLPPQAGYVEAAHDRFVNGYRSRGAYGLGWIHTPAAVAYLNAAAVIPLPASVKRAVLYARYSLPPP
jgi:hypothetical protein